MTAITTSLARGRLVPKEVGDKLRVDEFFNSVEQFVSILESSRLIGLRRLTTDELAGTTGQHEPATAGLLERYMSLSLRDEVVTLADMELDEELRVGGKYTKFYTISDIDDLPEWVYTNNRPGRRCGRGSVHRTVQRIGQLRGSRVADAALQPHLQPVYFHRGQADCLSKAGTTGFADAVAGKFWQRQ